MLGNLNLQRAYAIRQFLEDDSSGVPGAQKDAIRRKFGVYEDSLRTGCASESAEAILAEIEASIRGLNYPESLDTFYLLLHASASEVSPEVDVLAQSRTGATKFEELLQRIPRIGPGQPKELVHLGEYVLLKFDTVDDQGTSAVTCLRLALFLAAMSKGLHVNAALFRATSGSQAVVQNYINYLRSHRERTLILDPKFEICLPSWCRNGSPSSVADKINKFHPVRSSGLSGETTNNPKLKDFQIRPWRGASGDAYYLASASILEDDEVLFVDSTPTSFLQVEFLNPESSYDAALVDQIAGASVVHILGLTNENLASALEAVLMKRIDRPLKTLVIVFASDQIVRLIPAVDGLIAPHRLRRASGLKIIQHFRNSVGEELAEEFEIRESFHPLPFVGVRTCATHGEWKTRIGVCVPNRRNVNRPYMEVPTGRFGLVIEEAFDYFVSKANPIPNRVVVGTIENSKSAETFLPTGLQDKALLATMGGAHAEANVLIIVYRRFSKKDGVLLLQQRTKFNADDSLGKFSNLSARITESDCYSTTEGALGADPHIADKDAAFDGVLGALGISEGEALPDWVFVNAAIRECYAGLGLLPKSEDFRDHGTHSLRPKDSGAHRYFKILSLGLEASTFEEIAKHRPHANLSPVRINEVNNLRLNTFLREHLTMTFFPIFEELHLAK